MSEPEHFIPAKELGFKNEAHRDKHLLRLAEKYIESLKGQLKNCEKKLEEKK